MSERPALAALVVNYNTGVFAVGCVQSLLDEWRRMGRAREELSVVVVDNASPVDQEPWLQRLERMGALVVRHDENAGYAKGMNLAYARTTGRPGDMVAILNPDIYLLPGSVERLMGYLAEHRECGAIDPRACMDPLGVFHLPRNLLPTVAEHVRVSVAQLHPALTRLYSRRRVRYALPWWSAEGPILTDMLSGCCVFLRRSVADELPSLMDERYPLYYEDTDLFRTLAARGYTIVHHGGARILHHWSRSAGVGGQFADEPTRRYHISQKAYFEKFSGPFGRLVVRATNALLARWPRAKLARPMLPLEPLGHLHEPVELSFGRHVSYLVELGVASTFLLAGGILGEGERWRCPREAWDWLPEMRFYLRALDRTSGEVLGAWWFDKATPGRFEALSAEELAGLGERAWGVAS